jgi:chemotaxis protein MotB
MVSYMDVLSILLIFFMVAAAKSLEVPAAAQASVTEQPSTASAEPEPQPAEVVETVQAAATVEPAPPPATPPEAKQPRASLVRAQELLKEQGLEPKLESRGLVISVPQIVLFSSGQDAVNPQALPTLAQIAGVLRELPNDVRLVGYADTVPVHNRRFRSNWDLSMARSQRILELLSGRYGISEARLSIASYGPWRPAAPNDTPDGRASNRRVEIVILDESDAESPQAE